MGRGNKVTLRGLTYSTSKNGTRHYYYRKRGMKKIPLGTGPIDTPEFLARYAKAAKEHTPPPRAKEGSVRSVVNAFTSGTTWARYSKGYQSILMRHLRSLVDAYGDLPISGVQSHHIQRDIAKLGAHPANARLKTWRALCGFCVDMAWLSENPSLSVQKPKAAKSLGHAPWSRDEIETYRRRHPVGTPARLCMELLFWTGARTVDAVKLSPSMVSNGLLTFTQQKTGGPAHVPWSYVPDWADSTFADDRRTLMACLPRGSFTFLEQSGRARSHGGLSNNMAKWAKQAGLVRRTAHGLRKSRLIAIAEAGGSVHAIMSWGGHKSLSEAQEYIKNADRRRAVMERKVK